jgi:hypothetical protein
LRHTPFWGPLRKAVIFHPLLQYFTLGRKMFSASPFIRQDDADLATAVRVGVNQSDYSLTDYSE